MARISHLCAPVETLRVWRPLEEERVMSQRTRVYYFFIKQKL